VITLLVAGLVIVVILGGAAWTGGFLLVAAWRGLKLFGRAILWVVGGCKINLVTDLGPEREAEIKAQIAEAAEERRREKEERKAEPSVWEKCRIAGRESYAQTKAKIEAQKTEKAAARAAAKAAKNQAGA